MKKVIAALLLVGILGILVGCQNESGNGDEKNSEVLNSETNTETENHDISEISNYKLTELDLSSLFADGTTVLDLVVFDTDIYAVLKVVGKSDVIESNDNPYLLVSFDKNGSNLSYVALETPSIDGDVCMLKQFTIGQDGKVYALKVDYIDTSSEEANPKFDEGVRLVCWNTDGTLLSDIPLVVLDSEEYSDARIRNISISTEGDIALCCMHLNGGYFISHVNTNGTIDKILEDDLSLYAATHFKENNDGSLYSIRVKGTNGKSTHAYYINYDVNTQTVCEEITLPKDFDIMTCLSGENSESIYCFDDKGIYNYNIASKTTELTIDFKNSNLTTETILSMVPISENEYICVYMNGSTDGIQRIGFLRQWEK